MKHVSIGLFAMILAAGCRHGGNSETSARLIGSWEETAEIGEPTPHAPGTGPSIEFRAGTYTRRYPAAGRSPMEGTWHVTSASAQSAELAMTLQIGGSEMPVDAQRIVFRDANHIEIRNALNGHGGTYHRVGTP